MNFLSGFCFLNSNWTRRTYKFVSHTVILQHQYFHLFILKETCDSANNDGTAVYEDVEGVLLPSVYAELNREQQDGTVDNNYQKLLENDADNKDGDDVKTGSYDDVLGLYIKVNKTTGDNKTRSDKTYQERLENDAGNKHTDDVETGSYDDVLTSYAELNRNTRDNETRNEKTYQKLLKNNSGNNDSDNVGTG